LKISTTDTHRAALSKHHYSIYLQGMRRLDLTSSLGEVKKGIDTTEYEWIRELPIFSKKEGMTITYRYGG
jgi:hypothetical protein